MQTHEGLSTKLMQQSDC